jgi:FkbM family methyltransferase
MIQWLLDQTVRLAEYAQGVGAAGRPHPRTDKAVLQKLTRATHPLVIFDIGANRGDYSQLALKILAGKQLSIHAFEPSQTAFAELKQKLTPNQNLTLNNFALGSKQEERILYSNKPGSELSSLYERRIDYHGIQMTGQEHVKVETLDTYCASHQINSIDLLKLDAEGHELEILRGAPHLFESKKIVLIAFEFGGCNIDSRTYLRDFYELFVSHGMSLSRVTAFGTLRPISGYTEALERFKTTCFVATLSPPSK